MRDLPGNHPRVKQTSPETTQRRLRWLIQQLALRIQDRRLDTPTAIPLIPSRSIKPGATPEASESPGNGTPPTNPPNPAQPAPSTLLRRLVADCSGPSQRPKVHP